MKTVILIIIFSILSTGYLVANKATATVNNIKANQSYQLNLLNR